MEEVGAPDTLKVGTFSDAGGLTARMTGFGRGFQPGRLTAHVTAETGWPEVTDRGGGVVVTNSKMHVATAVATKPTTFVAECSVPVEEAKQSIEHFCGIADAV